MEQFLQLAAVVQYKRYYVIYHILTLKKYSKCLMFNMILPDNVPRASFIYARRLQLRMNINEHLLIWDTTLFLFKTMHIYESTVRTFRFYVFSCVPAPAHYTNSLETYLKHREMKLCFAKRRMSHFRSLCFYNDLGFFFRLQAFSLNVVLLKNIRNFLNLNFVICTVLYCVFQLRMHFSKSFRRC